MKIYEWAEGAKLEEHSHRKHKILREYVYDYLIVRCKLPQQERFRLAIVDGFAGAGRYNCGTAGSPLIFIEELRRAFEAINIDRITKGLRAIEIECLLIFNDSSRDTIEQLKMHASSLLAEIKESCSKLHFDVQYINEIFEGIYPEIKKIIEQKRYRNVLFNLDQCGHCHVKRETLADIMRSYPSAEIFYTFMIQSLLTYLPKNNIQKQKSQLSYLGLTEEDLKVLNDRASNQEWLGRIEKFVFDIFRGCAPYVSPFSINNPDGWRYWFMHFANFYRARQVYNNTLHKNASLQAHFGRSGLNMLSYDPEHENGTLYLFDDNGRIAAKQTLYDDIPRMMTDTGDAMAVLEFYESIYNRTPAHADDVHTAIIENPDIEVITPDGGMRRKANTIDIKDVIKLKTQRSFFPIFKTE